MEEGSGHVVERPECFVKSSQRVCRWRLPIIGKNRTRQRSAQQNPYIVAPTMARRAAMITNISTTRRAACIDLDGILLLHVDVRSQESALEQRW
jgi:hypothetical protein